ncbi:condensation domain-containing protein [Streptomyces sp. M19]
MADAPASLALPTDRPHPPQRDFHGATAEFRLPRQLTDELRALARRRDRTLFTVLLAAYRALLHRCTGRPDLVLGTLLADRDSAELADAVGCFVNPVPLRSRCARGPRSRHCWRTPRRCCATRSRTAGTRSAVWSPTSPRPGDRPRDAGAEPVRAPAGVRRAARRHLRPGPGDRRTGGVRAVTASVVPVERRWSQLDLSLSMALVDGELTGRWEYRTSLFDADTVAAMARHFSAVLRAVVAEPGLLVDEIPLSEDLTGDAGTGPARRRPDPGGLHRLVAAATAAHPDATAVLAPRRTAPPRT